MNLVLDLIFLPIKIFAVFLPFIIMLLKFTWLWLPLITTVILLYFDKYTNLFWDYIGIGILILTLIIACFMFIRNIIRLFKPEFAYSKLLKRNKADDDTISSVTFRTNTSCESDFVILDRKEYNQLLENQKQQYEYETRETPQSDDDFVVVKDRNKVYIQQQLDTAQQLTSVEKNIRTMDKGIKDISKSMDELDALIFNK